MVATRTLEILEGKLKMPEAIAIAKNSPTRSTGRAYLQRNGWNFMATQQQDPMRIGNLGRVFDTTSDNGCSVNYPTGPAEPACGA
jgi:hypothetical protein